MTSFSNYCQFRGRHHRLFGAGQIFIKCLRQPLKSLKLVFNILQVQPE